MVGPTREFPYDLKTWGLILTAAAMFPQMLVDVTHMEDCAISLWDCAGRAPDCTCRRNDYYQHYLRMNEAGLVK